MFFFSEIYCFFLSFRGYLSSASGFQSLQFRLIENKLGVKEVCLHFEKWRGEEKKYINFKTKPSISVIVLLFFN